MKFVSFSVDSERIHVGLADPIQGVVHDLSDRLPEGADLLHVIEAWSGLEQIDEDLDSLPTFPLDSVRLCAPIPAPQRNIFCVGKNYREHVVEFGRSGYDSPDRSESLPEAPVVFSKATTSVSGPYDKIESHPNVTNELDYEAELGIIIGRGGRGITREEAFDHVWGYTIIDDFTARDLQRTHKQWLLGKSLDTHCPMGPYAVTKDEVPDPEDLRVQSWINGEARQDAHVRDLIFDIPELVSTISAGITLFPGDIIATGTPVGVGIGFDPPKFLQTGDVVEISITGLGTQRNEVQ
ncbi:fumarylacetoacetate hydrolase family protein [Glutamicibacter sp. JL.03c]|uniref:fumarylacetoacetate hydrolase family protein n=1 Tax=Glutamicibacter sp. JL.03c TaxID=2984842 RepID=UPI0021F789AC|nr:fumarylacetoacetate hydrolase family protein [Glutamicibacter sp. JL.03c]UYQ77762.1 fumarylacetoacetate hydrolase family protein [Glutamicibacter sp. JL.03c]